MKAVMPALTPEQQQLVSDNYALCFWATHPSKTPPRFARLSDELRRRGLTNDDLLSLAGEALCRAVQTLNRERAGLSLWFSVCYWTDLHRELASVAARCRDTDRSKQMSRLNAYGASTAHPLDRTDHFDPAAAEPDDDERAELALLERLPAAVAALPPKARKLLRLRYGLAPYKRPRKHREIAARLGCHLRHAKRLVGRAEALLADLLDPPRTGRQAA